MSLKINATFIVLCLLSACSEFINNDSVDIPVFSLITEGVTIRSQDYSNGITVMFIGLDASDIDIDYEPLNSLRDELDVPFALVSVIPSDNESKTGDIIYSNSVHSAFVAKYHATNFVVAYKHGKESIIITKAALSEDKLRLLKEYILNDYNDINEAIFDSEIEKIEGIDQIYQYVSCNSPADHIIIIGSLAGCEPGQNIFEAISLFKHYFLSENTCILLDASFSISDITHIKCNYNINYDIHIMNDSISSIYGRLNHAMYGNNSNILLNYRDGVLNSCLLLNYNCEGVYDR